MAMDTLEEKKFYPCKPATEEKLDEAVSDATCGFVDGVRLLKRTTYQIPKDQISWSSVRSLRILGAADEDCNKNLKRVGLEPGWYINRRGNWLLLIHPGEAELRLAQSRCGQTLKSLGMYHTAFQTLDLSPWTGLVELKINHDWALSAIQGLSGLGQLETLDLSLCKSLNQLPELSGLGQLTTLNLSGCRSLTQLPELSGLGQLTTLNLIDCVNLEQLPELSGLGQLTTLNLEGCRSLTRLPELSGLGQLTTLELWECTSLAQLPELSGLGQLTTLNLSLCRSLAQLPDLSGLGQLKALHLSDCVNLTQLPDLSGLGQLTKLDLSNCGIQELPEGIRNLKSLRRLNLCSLNLRDLPDWLPEIAEQFTLEYKPSTGEKRAVVNLYKTKVESIPDMSIFEQPYEMVVEFFRKRAAGKTQTLNEIKVVFLGDGEAGKSHTIARLMNDGGDPDKEIFDGQSTPGIVIRHKDYTQDGRSFQVNYWDFGGQEIMHSMHRIFLTGRTMYVILLNARDDTQGDRAKYWLHNVKSFAPDAPVLLVLNKIDQNENASVDERDLRGRYDKLTQVVRLSALKYNQEDFNGKFTAVLLDEIQKTGYLDARWPSDWKRVKEELENMASHYIMGEAYEEICARCHVDQNQKELLRWFNDLGVSFCYDGDEDYALKDYVILRPDWITNALYIILFNKLEGVQNGLIPHSSIFNTLRTAHNNPDIRCTLPQARYNGGDIQYVLGVMRKFNLSFPHGTDYEFIPMLCQQNSTVDIQYYHRDAETLEFNMEFDYLPNNLLHRLMVERHSELDMDKVWRTGARFEIKELGLSAVVVIDGNDLRFFVRHTDPMHRPNTYLAMLKANVDKIVKKMGIKAPSCKLVYKLEGKQDVFDYDYLMLLKDVGQSHALSTAHRRMISIDDILRNAAPAASEDLNTLLNGIISAGLHLQGNKNYRGWDENGRNSVVRDSLGDNGYIVLDQNLRGTSETGKSYGELDLVIQRVPNRPWVLCEALIAEGYTHKWNEHLDKLLNEYNPHGLSTLFLLTYVDCEKSKFDSIWTKYKQHILNDDPKNFIRVPETVSMDLHSEYEYIKIARCNYQRGIYAPAVYHIFVQMDHKP